MTETLSKLKTILGDQFFEEIAILEASEGDELSQVITNSKEIYCECKTLILKPNHAALILPTPSMVEVEKDLKFLQNSDTSFKNLKRGCYWLVDDMYKFEQMGYTKEINSQNQQRSSLASQNQEDKSEQVDGQQPQKAFQEASASQPEPSTSLPNGLRYLACAECNLCPLGWFDPKTQGSYLYVW